jgi:hypothetical protein
VTVEERNAEKEARMSPLARLLWDPFVWLVVAAEMSISRTRRRINRLIDRFNRSSW